MHVPDDNPLHWIEADSEAWSQRGLERRLRVVENASAARITLDGRTLINFGSNDYLGLATDARVIEAACRTARDFGWGATSSPLICGWRAPHDELCEALAEFEGTAAALVFPSGFAANSGVLAALATPADVVYLDRLAHACLVAGARISRAKLRVFPHNDADRLGEILTRERSRFGRAIIATEGLFSMDGDIPPLKELCAVAEQHQAILVVDEAHATGVLGANGRGACEAAGVLERVPVRVGTLSKALGSIGGFVAGSRALIDLILNRAPTFLFSTALPPAAAAAARESLRILRSEPDRRTRLHSLAESLRQALPGPVPGNGPIIPWPVGDSGRTIALANALSDAGLFVPAIRPPTVPEGTARLRISLTAAHDLDQMQILSQTLRDYI